MGNEKRFYWLKLKESFMHSDSVDFLMSQKDGANYVVLYQMLHLKTLNTDGRLERQIGEVIIPYDVDKIQRDCKWFTKDTIIVALELYKKLGLVYEDSNGTLTLTDHKNLIGSSSMDEHQRLLNAERQARYRERQRELPESVTVTDTVTDIVTDTVTLHRNVDIRDKILDIRDKEKDININNITSKISEEMEQAVLTWNALGISKVTKIPQNSDRYKQLKKRIEEYGIDEVLRAISVVGKSDFLNGTNDKGWNATFDWLVKPNNFLKVIEGNYDRSNKASGGYVTKTERAQREMEAAYDVTEQWLRSHQNDVE